MEKLGINVSDILQPFSLGEWNGTSRPGHIQGAGICGQLSARATSGLKTVIAGYLLACFHCRRHASFCVSSSVKHTRPAHSTASPMLLVTWAIIRVDVDRKRDICEIFARPSHCAIYTVLRVGDASFVRILSYLRVFWEIISTPSSVKYIIFYRGCSWGLPTVTFQKVLSIMVCTEIIRRFKTEIEIIQSNRNKNIRMLLISFYSVCSI